jgi:putative ABC transport system ATP-binding protein
MARLVIEKLIKTYGAGHTKIQAVDNVSLEVEAGEIVLIMGPSGSGKTTLLTIAGGLLTPTAGHIYLDGVCLTKLTEAELPQLRLQKMGFVFQSFNLLAALTAQENVALPLIAAGLKRSVAMATAKTALEKFGLGERLDHLPATLSGGEKQRVSTARAIVNNPAIIFADEPTANLDSKIGHQVMDLLCSIACREQRAVVIVSHDQRLASIAHRVIEFEDGRVKRIRPGKHGKMCQHTRMPFGDSPLT